MSDRVFVKPGWVVVRDEHDVRPRRASLSLAGATREAKELMGPPGCEIVVLDDEDKVTDVIMIKYVSSRAAA